MLGLKASISVLPVSLLQRSANGNGGSGKTSNENGSQWPLQVEPGGDAVVQFASSAGAQPAGPSLGSQHKGLKAADVDDPKFVHDARSSELQQLPEIIVSAGTSGRAHHLSKSGSRPGAGKVEGQKIVQSSLQSFFSRARVKEILDKNGQCPEPIMLQSASAQQVGARCYSEAIAVKDAAGASREFELEEGCSTHCEATKIECGMVTRTEDGVSGVLVEEAKRGAAAEWQRIQRAMAANVPVCKGHGEPCVARQVKKSGPNVGRGFYVCARAQVLNLPLPVSSAVSTAQSSIQVH